MVGKFILPSVYVCVYLCHITQLYFQDWCTLDFKIFSLVFCHLCSHHMCQPASCISRLWPPQWSVWCNITAKSTATSVVQVHGHAFISSAIVCFPWLSAALTEPGSRGFPLITNKEPTEISWSLKVPKLPHYPRPISPQHDTFKSLPNQEKMD